MPFIPRDEQRVAEATRFVESLPGFSPNRGRQGRQGPGLPGPMMLGKMTEKATVSPATVASCDILAGTGTEGGAGTTAATRQVWAFGADIESGEYVYIFPANNRLYAAKAVLAGAKDPYAVQLYASGWTPAAGGTEASFTSFSGSVPAGGGAAPDTSAPFFPEFAAGKYVIRANASNPASIKLKIDVSWLLKFDKSHAPGSGSNVWAVAAEVLNAQPTQDTLYFAAWAPQTAGTDPFQNIKTGASVAASVWCTLAPGAYTTVKSTIATDNALKDGANIVGGNISMLATLIRQEF